MKEYWNCTKLADKLRGTAKPPAATWKGWREWEKQAQESHPTRYWLTEKFLPKLEDFVKWPHTKFNDIRYYINNRWVSKTHALTAHPNDIKPGNWQDVGYRFLPCLFNELVDYVEIELAWNNAMWNDEIRKKYATPWWRTSFLKLRTWRCPEAGLEYLEWASKLTYDESGELSAQALSAIEIKKLYDWWKNIYPTRPDIHDVTGWSAYCETKEHLFDDEKSDEEKAQVKAILGNIQDIEKQYFDEDTEMMVRLIKIRDSLWT